MRLLEESNATQESFLVLYIVKMTPLVFKITNDNGEKYYKIQ